MKELEKKYRSSIIKSSTLHLTTHEDSELRGLSILAKRGKIPANPGLHRFFSTSSYANYMAFKAAESFGFKPDASSEEIKKKAMKEYNSIVSLKI